MRTLIDLDVVLDEAPVFRIPGADGTGFPGCAGVLVDGPQGWGEFRTTPGRFARATPESLLTAAMEPGTVGWPDPVRGHVPVAARIPAVAPETARSLAAGGGCRAADVDAGGPRNGDRDAERIAAVRDALGPGGAIRLTLTARVPPAAAAALVRRLDDASGGLAWVAWPGADDDDLAALARAVDRPVAAALAPGGRLPAVADVALVDCAALGGVRRALRTASECRRPVVVTSPGESSIGLAAAVALAGALPELPFACALGGIPLLDGDLVAPRRSLVPVDGRLPVAASPPAPDPEALRRYAVDDPSAVAAARAVMRAALAARPGS